MTFYTYSVNRIKFYKFRNLIIFDMTHSYQKRTVKGATKKNEKGKKRLLNNSDHFEII